MTRCKNLKPLNDINGHKNQIYVFNHIPSIFKPVSLHTLTKHVLNTNSKTSKYSVMLS